MKKGKFGLTFMFYAVLGFAFAMLGQTLMCAVLAGFVLLVEKDEWTAKLNIQALGLSIYWSAASLVLSLVRSLLSAMFSRFGFYYSISGLISFVDVAIDVLFIAFALSAIMNLKNGKEVKTPFATDFANWAYGIAVQKAQPQNVQQPYQRQPQNMQQPYQGQPQNMQQPYQGPQQNQ